MTSGSCEFVYCQQHSNEHEAIKVCDTLVKFNQIVINESSFELPTLLRTRHNNLDSDFLLHDLNQKMYKVRKNKIKTSVFFFEIESSINNISSVHWCVRSSYYTPHYDADEKKHD